MARTAGLQKTGGRKKGTPNKKTLGLQEALESHGLDVIARLAEILPDLAPEKRVDVLVDLMGYLYPKRKAVEQQIVVDAKVEATTQLNKKTDEELRLSVARIHRRSAKLATDPALSAAHDLIADHHEREAANPPPVFPGSIFDKDRL
jgi:hypothetical protein